MQRSPKISIITPTFNQGKFIEKTIQSVIEQDYDNVEYIIIDGGSTDETVEIIRKYEKHLAFWSSEKDSGQSEAINKGFAKTTGDIVAWINSDDWYQPGAFKVVSTLFVSHEVDIVVGDCNMIYQSAPERNFIDSPRHVSIQKMLRYWQPFFCPPQPSIFFKKALIDKVGYIDESLRYGMDLDFWLRLAKLAKFHYVDRVLSNYLVHDGSKSGSDNGFEKFVAEWHKVSFRHAKSLNILKRTKFYYDFLTKPKRYY